MTQRRTVVAYTKQPMGFLHQNSSLIRDTMDNTEHTARNGTKVSHTADSEEPIMVRTGAQALGVMSIPNVNLD